jgi:hypothetical protein
VPSRWISAPLTLVLLLSIGVAQILPQQVRPAVWAGNQVESLPLPTAGYQVYFIGEQHGLKENADFQLAYMAMLVNRANLRDVAIEEKSVYERDAQSYIDGGAKPLPAVLCLRASLLRRIRQLNSQLDPSRRVRIHLIDVDSPSSAICEHLVLLSKRIPHADTIIVPPPGEVKEHGQESVRALEKMTSDSQTRSELRSVAFAIRALQDGFEVGTGPAKGSPYLDEREEAMTENVEEQIRKGAKGGMLVICGFDHVSRRKRADGGPNRDEPFWPMAARLERSGLRVFTLVTFPLGGETFWRGRASQLLWGPNDGHLSSGERLDTVISSAPSMKLFYIDALREHVRLPSEDASNYGSNAFLLFVLGHAMAEECDLPERH